MIANKVIGTSMNCWIQLMMPCFRLLTYPNVFPDVTEFYCIRSIDSFRWLFFLVLHSHI